MFLYCCVQVRTSILWLKWMLLHCWRSPPSSGLRGSGWTWLASLERACSSRSFMIVTLRLDFCPIHDHVTYCCHQEQVGHCNELLNLEIALQKTSEVLWFWLTLLLPWIFWPLISGLHLWDADHWSQAQLRWSLQVWGVIPGQVWQLQLWPNCAWWVPSHTVQSLGAD